MGFPPKGTGIPLVDFALFVVFLWLAFPIFPFVRSGDASAGRTYGPVQNWLFFFLFAILAILFFLAWIGDLGAHV